MEKRLLQKEENLEKRVDLLEQKEAGLTKREKAIQQQERTVGEKKTLRPDDRGTAPSPGTDRRITAEEAKDRFMKLVESEMRHESAKLIKRIEEEPRARRTRRPGDHRGRDPALCGRLCG